MKIGQITIDVYFDPEHGKFHFSTEPEEVQQGTQSTGKVETSTAPEEVHLDPDSDTFVEDKAALKQKGYFFNRSSKTWRKKKGSGTADANGSQHPAPAVQADWYGDATEIELSQDDPNFDSKKDALKSAGFRWDGKEKVWRKAGK